MDNKTSLELHFLTAEAPELVKTVFNCPQIESPIIGMRGELVPRNAVPFRWTTAIHALSLCFVNAALNSASGKEFDAALVGAHGTPASSVDFLIQKSHLWVLDLFGTDVKGRTLLRRIFTVMNSRCTMPGPVQVFVKTNILKAANISLYLDGNKVSDQNGLSALSDALRGSWKPGIATSLRTQKAMKRKGNNKAPAKGAPELALAA